MKIKCGFQFGGRITFKALCLYFVLDFFTYSLGMSWLSGRLVQNVPLATSTLDSLKASILGLGKANCEVIYQRCDLRRERKARKRRRRKRSV